MINKYFFIYFYLNVIALVIENVVNQFMTRNGSFTHIFLLTYQIWYMINQIHSMFTLYCQYYFATINSMHLSTPWFNCFHSNQTLPLLSHFCSYITYLQFLFCLHKTRTKIVHKNRRSKSNKIHSTFPKHESSLMWP